MQWQSAELDQLDECYDRWVALNTCCVLSESFTPLKLTFINVDIKALNYP